jgi:hypothetical protein
LEWSTPRAQQQGGLEHPGAWHNHYILLARPGSNAKEINSNLKSYADGFNYAWALPRGRRPLVGPALPRLRFLAKMVIKRNGIDSIDVANAVWATAHGVKYGLRMRAAQVSLNRLKLRIIPDITRTDNSEETNSGHALFLSRPATIASSDI